MWPAVERLRVDMRSTNAKTQTNTMAELEPNAVKALELLSTWLLSIREIEFYGPHSKSTYGYVLIERLIKEWLHRHESLRVVCVNYDYWPKLIDDYNTGKTALAIYVECMEIDGPDESHLIPVPIMMADTLVELKLISVIVGYEWDLFEPGGDSEFAGSSISIAPAIQLSLQKLTLSLADIEEELHYSMEDNYGYQERSCEFLDKDECEYCGGEYGQHDVEYMLHMFSNLRRLNVCAILSEPIFSVSELVDRYRRMVTNRPLKPIHSSLRILNVHGKHYFSGYNGLDYIPELERAMAQELNHY
ncbi:hypothetical protein GGH94_005052 [Coemansia aciculifera]|uniref:Uncharacterized protein n=1 Tax=Coemansia aciculifera TaxID=417176 RepID=A0A9W8IE86_9FUNG|nr:hypothetical protein GGH94_005052 [Coemansia aciculifera]